MFDDGIEILAIGLPLLHAFLGVALKLPFLKFESSLGLLVRLKFLSQLLFSLILLFLHLPFEIFSIFCIEVLSEFFVVVLSFLEGRQFVIPGIFEVLIVSDFLLFFSFSPFNLIFQRLFILLFQNFLLILLLSLNLSLFLLKLLDLRVESFNFIIFHLTHLKSLLFVELLSLFDFFIDEVLLSFLGHVLNLL